MSFMLPPLPYAYDALEPYIDAKTMEVHYTKHHQTYVDKLNDALKNYPDLQQKPLEELLSDLDSVPNEVHAAINNFGGGHLNHSIFWTLLSPKQDQSPQGSLEVALNQTFGSVQAFKERFSAVATSHFGSGWAWLIYHPDLEHHAIAKLEIYSLPNQDSPYSKGDIPLLGLDVWEHAYYLKYQNRRPEYIDAFWHLVNWPMVNTAYQRAIG
jgi:superoxide dismutase, Fe-Mn family